MGLTHLPVLDSWIMKPSSQKTGWVFHSFLDIIHGGISHHVIEELFFIRISQFFPVGTMKENFLCVGKKKKDYQFEGNSKEKSILTTRLLSKELTNQPL